MGFEEYAYFITWVIAGFINGISGMGGALVAVPIASFYLPPTILTPSICIIAMAVCAHMAWVYRAGIRYQSLKTLIIGSIPGAAAGVLLLIFVQPKHIQLATGIFMLIFVVWHFMASRFIVMQHPETKGKGLFAGFSSGLIGASIGISNPPVGAYALYLGWNQSQTFGTINIFSVIAYIFACVIQASSGLFTADVIKFGAIGVPACIIGSICSIPIAKKVPVATFRMLLLLVIASGGVVCLWRGVNAM